MLYRLATQDEIEECAKLMADAFFSYEFSKIYCTENEERRFRFTHAIQWTAARIYCNRKRLLVGVDEGEIVACAFLDAPGETPPSILELLQNGIYKAVLAGGLWNTLQYSKLLETTECHCREIREPHWYFAGFGVKPSRQGKGYGSQMLQECVFPYIAKNGGGRLVFVTNSESNARFYTRNGCVQLFFEELQFDGKALGNWTFEKEILPDS